MSTKEKKGGSGCWICGQEGRTEFLAGTQLAEVGPDAVRITDSQYGRSAPLSRCVDCGFIYADPLPSQDMLALYEDLEDPDYVDGSDYRLQQMRHLLNQVLDGREPTSLLDVGAGTGLLVEAAAERGIDAVGVEPSRYLADVGRRRGQRVLTGVHPHPELDGQRFEFVTCADVIEHVTEPIALLESLAGSVVPGGRVVVTTPDVESKAARWLGSRWWHFRVAHISFFPESAMHEATRRAGLRIVRRTRQRWWFSSPYLAARAVAMVAGATSGRQLEAALSRTPLRRLHIPLDLRDSWVYHCEAR